MNHTFENVGNYMVTLKVSANYSSDSASRTVRVTFMTDLDENGIVDIIDKTAVTKARGSRPGDPNWNTLADFYKNGIVNIIDPSTTRALESLLIRCEYGVQAGQSKTSSLTLFTFANIQLRNLCSRFSEKTICRLV
jgi:hypothetical protein